MTREAATVALGLSYPHPGAAEVLQSTVDAMPNGRVRESMSLFSAAVGSLPVEEWEELHTRTLDLSPLFVPYVGHQAWGDSYRRGAFMADLQRAQWEAEVDQQGELPDHLIPVLRYLAVDGTPLADLVEVLPAAVASMRKELAKAEPDNPYRYLLEAVAEIATRVNEGASA